MLCEARWYVFKSVYYQLPVILFIIHQSAQYLFKFHIPFLDNYLDPLLFIPIVLGAYLQERNILRGKKSTLTTLEIILISAVLCLSVEYIFQFINSNLVSDSWDLIPYTLGAVYFGWTINNL